MGSNNNTRVAAGGAANQVGIKYQNQVAAWVCVRVLAEHEATPPWGVPGDAALEFLRCETDRPVDDLLVGTSHGGHALIQVEHTVTASRSTNSAPASALEQFVRQFASYSGSVGESVRGAPPRPRVGSPRAGDQHEKLGARKGTSAGSARACASTHTRSKP